VVQFGANAFGEILEPGRVSDCHLGLRLADDVQGPGVLVVAPAALLHPAVSQPDGTLLYEAGDRPPRPGAPGAGVSRRPDGGAARLAP
jgi:hypothetical protein